MGDHFKFRTFICNFIFAFVAMLFIPRMGKASSYVDFNVYYPVVSVKDHEYKKNKFHYLGLSLNYEYEIFEIVGLGFDMNLYAIPLKSQNDEKHRFVNAMISPMIILRPFQSLYLDPSLSVGAGIGIADLGEQRKLDTHFPALVKFGVSLFRYTSKFSDNSLSLVGHISFRKDFSDMGIIKPEYFNIGLGLRGSF